MTMPTGTRQPPATADGATAAERAPGTSLDTTNDIERFRLALEGTSDGLWDWNIAEHSVYFSPPWKSMLGYADDEIPNKTEEWMQHIHPDDRDRVLEDQQAFIEGIAPSYELEYRLRHKDGSYRWVRTRGTAVRDERGVAHRLIGWHTDITERKEAEQRLREKETQYQRIFESTGDGLIITTLDGVIVEANPAACTIHGSSRDEFLGLRFQSFIQLDSDRVFADLLDAARAGKSFQTRALCVQRDGDLLPVEIHGSALTYQGSPHMLVVMSDNSARARELSTLLRVSETIASTLELQPLFDLILDQLKVAVDYTGAAILTLDGDVAEVVGYRGPIPSELALGLRFTIAQALPIWEVVSRRKEPVIIPDVRADTALAKTYRELLGDQAESIFGYVHSWMGVPLLYKDEIIGGLSFESSEVNYYKQHHARLALAIASQVAVALENARLYQRTQTLAALEERQKLARELHDSVSQALYGIQLGARTARELLESDPAHAAEPLDYVGSLAEAGMIEMHALIFELRPESLEMEGLVAALRKQSAMMQARHNIEVREQLDEEPELPLEAKEALYRIAQEAMHNTLKHARATRIDLRLERTDAGIALDVRDNGSGFDASGAFPGHLGLRSMRERVKRLSGTLALESAPGQGTHVHVLVPMPAEAPHETSHES